MVETERVSPHPLSFVEGASRASDSYAKAATALEQLAESSCSTSFADSEEHDRAALARTLFDHTGVRPPPDLNSAAFEFEWFGLDLDLDLDLVLDLDFGLGYDLREQYCTELN